MGKIGKPQKRKRNKIKTHGWHKNNKTVNRAPKCLEQEIPRKLKELGVAIKECQSGKKNRNKFKNKPDGPNSNFGDVPPSSKMKKSVRMPKVATPVDRPGEKKMGNKMKKLTQQATETYIDNLKPTRPLLENFKFKQRSKESDRQFLKRVERETAFQLTKSRIDDQFDTSDKDQLKEIIKSKLVTQKREKKKQKEADAAEEAMPNVQNKQQEKEVIKDFATLQDDVPFGEVVHAPPVLSVLPKRATRGHDRPGLRMPHLKDAFSKKTGDSTSNQLNRKIGETVKKKNLTKRQQYDSDVKREQFVDAYRQMKKKRKLTTNA